MYKVNYRVAIDDPLTCEDKVAYDALEDALRSAQSKLVCADVTISDEAIGKIYDRRHIVEMLKRI